MATVTSKLMLHPLITCFSTFGLVVTRPALYFWVQTCFFIALSSKWQSRFDAQIYRPWYTVISPSPTMSCEFAIYLKTEWKTWKCMYNPVKLFVYVCICCRKTPGTIDVIGRQTATISRVEGRRRHNLEGNNIQVTYVTCSHSLLNLHCKTNMPASCLGTESFDFNTCRWSRNIPALRLNLPRCHHLSFPQDHCLQTSHLLHSSLLLSVRLHL